MKNIEDVIRYLEECQDSHRALAKEVPVQVRRGAVGDVKFHRGCIQQYGRAIAILRRHLDESG